MPFADRENLPINRIRPALGKLPANQPGPLRLETIHAFADAPWSDSA